MVAAVVEVLRTCFGCVVNKEHDLALAVAALGGRTRRVRGRGGQDG